VAQLDNPDMQTVWNAQLQQFRSRRASLEGGRQVLREKINQLEEQIIGNEQQASALDSEAEAHGLFANVAWDAIKETCGGHE
jgi:HlyD family secretion protein/epimerase transport system membrane fusion protein